MIAYNFIMTGTTEGFSARLEDGDGNLILTCDTDGVPHDWIMEINDKIFSVVHEEN